MFSGEVASGFPLRLAAIFPFSYAAETSSSESEGSFSPEPPVIRTAAGRRGTENGFNAGVTALGSRRGGGGRLRHNRSLRWCRERGVSAHLWISVPIVSP